MLTLEKQTILITGASRGIGAATAKVALEAGATVVGSYNRSAGALEQLAADYGSERVHALQADLGQPGAGSILWRDSLSRAGRIDGLVNNAGIAPATKIDGDYSGW